MATPSNTHPAVTKMLDRVANRTASIKADVCVPKPIGCGGPATQFRDELSQREYTISGLCQKCQDVIFGGDVR
jgi:hypothetical protein